MIIKAISSVFLVIALFVSVCFSQQPNLQYIKYDTINGNSAMDKNFNIYMAGVYVSPSHIWSWQISKLDKNQNLLWTRNYQRYTNEFGLPRSLVVDDSCNVYVTGYYVASSVKEEAVTMKLDSLGNTKWIVVEPNLGLYSDEANKIILGKDGYLYIAGNSTRFSEDADIFLMKFSTGGERIWKRTYNTPGYVTDPEDNYSNLAVDELGNSYITYGMSNSPNPSKASLLKYDKDGNLKFVYTDFDYYSSLTRNLTINKNKEIYVCGETKDSASDNPDVIIYKLDSSGTLNWKKKFNYGNEYTHEAYDILCDSSGNVFIGGTCYVERSINPSRFEYNLFAVKYSPVGNLEWSKIKTGNILKSHGYFSGMKLDKYGSVYLLGSLFYSNSSLDGITQKYDNSGNELWNIRYAYQDSSYDFLQIQHFYPDNDFLLIGGYTTNSTPAISKITYMRYSQPVKITNTGNTIPDKFELSQNYPNPFNPQTKIKFNIVQKDVYTLKLYDITGRELMRMGFDNLAPGSYEYTFNMNNFASGNYFYELSSSKERIVKQMLLIK